MMSPHKSINISIKRVFFLNSIRKKGRFAAFPLAPAPLKGGRGANDVVPMVRSYPYDNGQWTVLTLILYFMPGPNGSSYLTSGKVNIDDLQMRIDF